VSEKQDSFLFWCTRYYNYVVHYRLTYARGLHDGVVWGKRGWALDRREEVKADRGRRHPLIECQYDYTCHAASKPRSMVHLVVLFNTLKLDAIGYLGLTKSTRYSIRSFITLIGQLIDTNALYTLWYYVIYITF